MLFSGIKNNLLSLLNKLKVGLSLLFILFPILTNAQVIISEYLEGASNDKCIELYNTGSTSVNLDNYSLRIYFNGNTASTNIDLPNADLNSCETYVICHSSANLDLTGASDLTTGALSFNGNDAIELFDGTSVVDLFGNIGDDPGTEWIGIGNGTANGRFERTLSNCAGITNDPTGTGPTSFTSFTVANWQSITSLSSAATLGSHSSSCGSCSVLPPHLTAVIINSCDGSCDEGDNEIVVGNTGGYSLEVTAANFNFLYGNTDPAAINYTDVLVQNAVTTVAVNTAAGCPGTFLEGTNVTMPPNSSFILAPNSMCSDALDWTNLCGSSPIYIIYQNDVDWVSGGNFVNDTGQGMRYFRLETTTTDGTTHIFDSNFDSDLTPQSEGAFVTYNSTGGAPTSYDDDDCMLEPNILPAELISFSGKFIGQGTLLKWETASERNTDYFQLERSQNGFDFEVIGNVGAAGNSTTNLSYSYLDKKAGEGNNYYRLMTFDFDNAIEQHGVIAVFKDAEKTFFDQQNQIIHIREGKGLSVYSPDGRLILNAENESQVSFSKKGVFLILNQSTGETLRIVNQ